MNEIRSNLRTATSSWDDERMHTPEQERMLRAAEALPIEKREVQQDLEALHRKHEEAVNAAKPQRLPGQERWQGKENEEMRLVRIMHPHRIFFLLRRAGVDARIESPVHTVWAPGKMGDLERIKIVQNTGRLWFNDDSRVGRIGVNAWVKAEGTGMPEMRTVTTLQYPYGPEWSMFHFNEFGVATAEKYRGWRTAMLQMIYANVLTEEEVDRAFGPVVMNRASEFYREQLQRNRQRRAGLQ